MRALLALSWLTLLTLTFAGCLSSPDVAPEDPFEATATDTHGHAVPHLLCHDAIEITATTEEIPGAAAWSDFEFVPGTRCNFEMTPDEGREGNEVTIAVNPTDPRNIVGGAKDYYPADAGECVWDGIYVTHDGAATPYNDRSFDGSPWRQLNAPDLNTTNYATQFWCTTDPVAYFDVHGNLYYLLMAYQTDPVTGSKTGEEELPQGALNDWAFNRATQIVAVSDNGGDSFHTFTPVLEGTFPVNFHDKGWLAASPDGTIHVMWLAFFVPGNQYCRSTDGGQTYLCTEVIATQFIEAGQGSFLEVGTTTEVYAAWYRGGIRLARSFDTGETWDAGRVVLEVELGDMPGLSPRDRRSVDPMMATDRNPRSPYADAIYFVWQAPQEGGGTKIMFSSSFDFGETFSAPVQVSQSTADAYEIFPAVSVSPGGVIDVSWMDTAGNPPATLDGDPHDTFGQKYAYSRDGGRTWSVEFSVRDVDAPWDPALCHHQNGMIFIGDYNDIDSSWQAAHPVWPDSRHGVCDVYTATIERPVFAQGWDAAGRADAEAWIAAHPLV